MPDPVSHRIDANGIALVVHDWGGHGPPVLLAHPTGFHGRVWAPVAGRLVAAGRRVWSFDFRGHGDSDAPPVESADYSWPAFADDALAVVSDLGLAGDPQLVACGHSKGGVALLLGEHKRPGTYARIWTYEPVVFESDETLPPNDDFPLARSARKRRNVWASIDEAYASYASRPPLDVMTPESLRAYVEYGLRARADGTFELKCRPEVEARVYAMGPSNGAWAMLPDITSSVNVACGEASTHIGPELAMQIAQRLPRGELEVMPRLGHFGPQEAPDVCANSVLRFLDISHAAG